MHAGFGYLLLPCICLLFPLLCSVCLLFSVFSSIVSSGAKLAFSSLNFSNLRDLMW